MRSAAVLAAVLLAAGCSSDGPAPGTNPNVKADATYEVVFSPKLK